MFCPMCGKENPDGARFCGQCGYDLSGHARSSQVSSSASVSAPAPVSGPSFVANSGKRSLLILVVAAVAIVAVVIFGVTQCFGGGGKRSAQDLVDGLTPLYQRVFDDGFSDESVDAFAEAVFDAMPPEAIESVIEEGVVDDREELIDQFGDGFFAATSGAESVYDKLDVDVQMTIGDEIDDDVIDSLNEEFKDNDLSLEVTEAYAIGVDMTMTAREDVGTIEAGESTSREIGNMGYMAVKIGNGWYVWMRGLSW
jgi:hypothetical protein